MARTLVAFTVAALLLAIAAGAAPPNLADAIEKHRQLAAESPTPGVLNDLANLLVLDGQHPEAASIYRRVLSMDSYNVEAQFNLGLLLQSQGHLEEAEQLFTSVIERDPQHSWAFYQLGSIHEASDLRYEAIDAYATALALDPELFFADVNPQVVSNQLLTEALLEAARRRESRSLAPMKYARPREITEMLLTLPPPAEESPEDDS